MRRLQTPLAQIGFVLLLALATLTGCGLESLWEGGGGGGGGGGSLATQLESEPNEGILLSDPILINRPIQGDVEVPEDQDWFSLRLLEGRTVQVELLGTRFDQANWEAAATVPRLTVIFPLEEDKLIEHSFASGWSFAAQDFDIPLFRVTRTGTYWFVVSADTELAAGARYVLRIKDVIPAPNVLEIEEESETGVDDTPGTAQAIPPGLLMGFHKDGNEDYYALNLPAPRVVRVEAISSRNGAWEGATGVYDPLLRLYDVDGTTILAENDDAFFHDPAIHYEVAGGGVYRIQVTQSPASADDAPYYLRISTDPASGIVETEPNDTPVGADSIAYGQAVSGVTAPGVEDWYGFAGTAGDMVRLQVFDAVNSQPASEPLEVVFFAPGGTTPLASHTGPVLQVMTTILQQDGTHYFRVRTGAAAVGATSYRLELRRFHSSVYETEPNDSITAAPAFPAGGFAAGGIATAGDRDLLRFTATSRELVTFAVYAGAAATGSDGFSEYSGHGSVLAPVVTIRDTTGFPVKSSTSQPAGATFTEGIIEGLPTASVAFVAPPTATTFYVEVTSADGTGSGDHYYVLQRR